MNYPGSPFLHVQFFNQLCIPHIAPNGANEFRGESFFYRHMAPLEPLHNHVIDINRSQSNIFIICNHIRFNKVPGSQCKIFGRTSYHIQSIIFILQNPMIQKGSGGAVCLQKKIRLVCMVAPLGAICLCLISTHS